MRVLVLNNLTREYGMSLSWLMCKSCDWRRTLTGFWLDLGKKSILVRWRPRRCLGCQEYE